MHKEKMAYKQKEMVILQFFLYANDCTLGKDMRNNQIILFCE